MSRKSNTGALGGSKNPDAWINWPFDFSLPRNIKLPEAKTKDQTIQKRTEPAFIEPMQCKPVTALPAGEKWTFEIKFDGYRCIAVKRGREVTLFSRHKKVLNKRFSGVVEALALLDGDFVLDGELVALDSQGLPSFQLIQNNSSQDLPIYFYAFDLLHRNGKLLLSLSIERAAGSAPPSIHRLLQPPRRIHSLNVRRHSDHSLNHCKPVETTLCQKLRT